MRIFVAGATGATGVVFVELATARGHELVLHVRPQTAARHALGRDPRARVFELADIAAGAEAMRGCDAVVSLVGTMRARFAAGDTYESADVGSTRQLVAAAREAGVGRFLLLSSFGAGGAGAYLQMKGECERLVRESGLRWTVFRPSALASPPGPEGNHGRREVPGFVLAAGAALRAVPGLQGVADDWRAIPIDVVARAMLAVLAGPRDGAILNGRELWPLGAS